MSQAPPPQNNVYASPPPPPQAVAVPPKGKGLAIAALVLGLCGIIPLLGILCALVGLILAIIALAGSRPGKGLAIGGLVAALVTPIFGQLATAILVPTLFQANELTNRTVCMSNLSSIGKSIVLYKGANDNKWPPTLMESLMADGQPAKLLRCPSAKEGDNRSSDYFYLAPKDDNQPDQIVVCDFKGNHKDKRTVLYVGMHVRVLSEAEFQAELAKPENAAFAAALIMITIPEAMRVPVLRQANELTNRTVCMSNLSSIGKSIILYKGSNDNKWPVNLMEDLVADGQSTKLFGCPSAKAGRACDYFYLPPANDNQLDAIAVCDLADNHKNRRNVLYVGMNVRQMTEAEFQAELAKPVNAAFAAALRKAEGP